MDKQEFFLMFNIVTLKQTGVGDPTSKGSFTLERLRLGLNLSVTLLLEFDIFGNLV